MLVMSLSLHNFLLPSMLSHRDSVSSETETMHAYYGDKDTNPSVIQNGI